jgi:HprK-related kinase A
VLIGDIPRAALVRRLRREGVHVDTGAFSTHLHIELPHLAHEFAQMYAHYPVEDPPGIDDARLRIGPTSLFSRFVAPSAAAWMDGEKLFDPVPAARAYTVLESALNWGIAASPLAPMLMHGAVVERMGKAVIMPAPTGSGKSTLCAALSWRGWRLLSDEMVVFSFADGAILPNPRPVSLKNKAIQTIAAFEQRAQFSATYTGTAKGDVAYMRPPLEAISRFKESAIPSLVVAPQFHDGVTASLKRMDKIEGLRWLIDNTVNYSSMLQMGFDRLTGIAHSCDFYILTYSNLDEAVEMMNRLHEGSAAVACGR